MKSIVSIISIIYVILMASVCQSAETVKIAAIGAKTGDAATSYASLFPAIRLAAEELNKQGGLLGKQIEVLELDNKSTSLGSKIAAQKAVEAGVAAVIGAYWSSHSLAMAPVLQAAQIPMISPLSTNPKVTLVGDYIFRVCFIDPFQGAVLANFALQDLNAKTAVVLTQAGNAYSMGLAQNFKKGFQKSEGKILWEESYSKGATNFKQIVEKTGSLNPDVVFLPGYPRESGFIIKQARKSGVSAIFLGGDGWGLPMYEYGGEAIHRNYYCVHWHEDSPSEKNQKLIQAYKIRYGEDTIVTVGVPLSYDAMLVFADAVRRADSLVPAQIRDALSATTNFQGVTGHISFDQNGDPVKSAVILKFDKETLTYVKTIEP